LAKRAHGPADREVQGSRKQRPALWTSGDVETLKQMAARGFTGAEIARKLKRSISAIYARVQLEGIALKRGINRIKARQASRRRK
jgi:hypothetical protein